MATVETFSNRITKLRENTGKKRQEIADKLNISRASLEYYEKGKRKPDIEILVKLADYYGVTCDYLLGLSNTPTTDENLAMICDFTGLSVNAVRSLAFRNSGEASDQLEVLNNMLENSSIFTLITQILIYKNSIVANTENINKVTNIEEYINYKENKYIDIDICLFKIQRQIVALCNNYCENEIKSYEEAENREVIKKCEMSENISKVAKTLFKFSEMSEQKIVDEILDKLRENHSEEGEQNGNNTEKE